MTTNRNIFSARLLAILSAAIAAGGCSLLQPIRSNQAGSIADPVIEEKNVGLGDLVERNRESPRDQDKAVMDTPAREGSGIIGEVDIDKALAKSRRGDGKAQGKASAVKLEFEDASLRDVITVFMKDYLKKPYTFKDTFKDRRINLFFEARATQEELVNMFDTLLENYGVRLRYSGGVYLIGSGEDKGDAVQQPSPLGIGDAVGIVRLKYIDAANFQAIARQITKNPEKISVLPGNLLVVNSTSTDLRAVRALLEDVDVPAFAGKYILVYSPRYLAPAALVATMDGTQTQLIGTQGAGRQYEIKQVGDTDRIVIVAANRAARDLVLQMLAQTDVAGANHRRVFQYTLGIQNAGEIVANLNNLIKSAIKGAGEITVTPDKISNSLFIYASPEEYAEIRKLLARMDYRPPAVEIDMVIAEVTLNDEMRYGVEWYLKKNGSVLADATATLGIPAAANSNFAFNIVNAAGNYAALQMLGAQTSYLLLSNPKIVVRNGATAQIKVGSEMPVIKQKTTNTGSANSTVVEPEFKKIGLELEVTPTVSAGNEVRVTIKLKDTAITGTVTLSADKYPILSNRELNTDLVVADGQTIFLGGIRKQETSDSASKIPGLGDIRGAGVLFSNKDTTNYGNELIILVTTHIILDQQGADTVTKAVLRAARQEFKELRAPLKAAPDKRPAEQTGAQLFGDLRQPEQTAPTEMPVVPESATP